MRAIGLQGLFLHTPGDRFMGLPEQGYYHPGVGWTRAHGPAVCLPHHPPCALTCRIVTAVCCWGASWAYCSGAFSNYLRIMTIRSYTPTGTIGKRLARAKALQQQIQQLEAQLSADREFLLAHMERRNLDRIETEGLLVVRKHRHNWSYSALCDNKALELRQLQLDEQVLGVASDRPRSYVSLTAVG